MKVKSAVLSQEAERPLITGGRAHFSIDDSKSLREWLSFFHKLFNTYGDVQAKTDAGYNSVSLVLTIPTRGECEAKAEARGTHRRTAPMGQQNRSARSRAARTQKAKARRRRQSAR